MMPRSCPSSLSQPLPPPPDQFHHLWSRKSAALREQGGRCRSYEASTFDLHIQAAIPSTRDEIISYDLMFVGKSMIIEEFTGNQKGTAGENGKQ